MKITMQLKAFLFAMHSVPLDAADDDVRKSVADLLGNGKLDMAKVTELTSVKSADGEGNVAGKAQQMIDASVSKAVAPLLDAIKAMQGNTGSMGNTPASPTAGSAPSGAKMYGTAAEFVSEDPEARIRVKSVVEQFSDNRTAATFDHSSNEYLKKSFGGRQVSDHVKDLGYQIDMPTERSKAIAGAWFKFLALKQSGCPAHIKMTELDNQLVQYAVHECKFVGEAGRFDLTAERLVTPEMRKAVLDDSTSGGLYAVPIEFDANFVLTPLLNGQLFPFVDLTNVSRRRIESFKIANPTMYWGVAEGTAVAPFDTASFISSFNNNIYPITGAMELGLDFLNDSPVNIGAVIVQRYGQSYLKSLDDVIANGTGTNQPEGVFNASGVATVTPSASAGTPTVGDYEGLMFGVAKEFREEAGMPPNSRAMFIGTDTSYSRARGIQVNSSSDARRIFGMDQQSYQLFNYRYAINGSAGNTKIGFFCMNRYRMYRRQGLEVQIVTQDWTLAKQNKQGLILRARFGGALDHASAGAKITDAKA